MLIQPIYIYSDRGCKTEFSTNSKGIQLEEHSSDWAWYHPWQPCESWSNSWREVKLPSDQLGWATAAMAQIRGRPISCSATESKLTNLVMGNNCWHLALLFTIYLFHWWVEKAKERIKKREREFNDREAETILCLINLCCSRLCLPHYIISSKCWCLLLTQRRFLFFINSFDIYCKWNHDGNHVGFRFCVIFSKQGILLMLSLRGKTQTTSSQLAHFSFPYFYFRVESLRNTPAWASLS